MSTEPESEPEPSGRAAPGPAPSADPPTTPCTVVWCQGRAFVLEQASGRPRWMGTDAHGRPQSLSGAELQRRGWSYRRAS